MSMTCKKPAVFTPHDYQREDIQRVLDQRELGLFLDMGLGKTVICLTAIDKLINDHCLVSKCLIIAPLEVSKSTWTNEIASWQHLTRLRVSNIASAKGEKGRIKALVQKADIYIINRENVAWLVGFVGAKWPFDMVVVDELSSFKNDESIRFKQLNKVRPLIKRFVGLTGTPGDYVKLWALMKLIDQGKSLGASKRAYLDRFFDSKQVTANAAHRRYTLKQGAEDHIKELIQDTVISRQAKEYSELELPPITYIDYPVELDEKSLEAYKKFERDSVLEMVAAIEAQKVLGEETAPSAAQLVQLVALNAAALSGKLRQFANGAIYKHSAMEVQANREYIEVHNHKIEAISELVEQCNSNVVIFYEWQHDLERLQKALKEYKPVWIKDKYNGDIISDWNAGKIKVLLGHPLSMGHGLNLQYGGHYEIWMCPIWSTELWRQGVTRVYRQGQRYHTYIYRVHVPGLIEDDVISRQEDNISVEDKLMASVSALVKKHTGKTLEDIAKK